MKSLLLKLFLILTATVTAVVVLMMLLTRWSFDRGFIGYLDGIQQDKMEAVTRGLETWYALHQSWDDLLGNRDWIAITHPGENLPPPEEPFEFPPGAWPVPPPPPPPRVTDVTDIGPRVGLFTPDGRHVVGRRATWDGLPRWPVHYQETVVGWLTLIPLEGLSDQRDAAFAQQQRKDLYLIAAAVVLIAAVTAWLLAQRLLDPIRTVTAGARRLAGGDYETRVNVEGRDELHRLGEDFNRLAETLQANESARRRWIADISHELRTPIAVLRGEIEALQDGVRSLNESSLNSLHNETLHLGKLVEDLYQLAIADQGSLTYHKEPTDVAELFGQLFSGSERRLAEAGLTLELQPSREPLIVMADPDRLTQMVNNLLQNTLRYTDRGGRVVAAWKRHGTRIHFDLQDSAPAVPPESLPRLFERLYRVESSRNRARGGAGLGLSIVKAIVDAHHGIIKASASPLGGLWIHIELPEQHGGLR